MFTKVIDKQLTCSKGKNVMTEGFITSLIFVAEYVPIK
jgi:hypothetical protein